MPLYQTPEDPHAFVDLRKRVDALERQLHKVATKGGVTMPRMGIDPEVTPNPYEGQVILDNDSRAPYYYENGAWHPFGGSAGFGQWCRLSLQDDTTLTIPGERNIVDWDAEMNPYPEVFEIRNSDHGGTNNAIQPLIDGVYALTWGLYADVFTPTYPTNSPIWVAFEHTTWTHEEEVFGFPAFGDPGAGEDGFINLASNLITGTKVFRSGPRAAPSSYREVYMSVSIDSNADNDFGVIADYRVSYMELVLLTSEDPATNGNPYDDETTP